MKNQTNPVNYKPEDLVKYMQAKNAKKEERKRQKMAQQVQEGKKIQGIQRVPTEKRLMDKILEDQGKVRPEHLVLKELPPSDDEDPSPEKL